MAKNSRRSFLKSAGAIGVGSLAGCASPEQLRQPTRLPPDFPEPGEFDFPTVLPLPFAHGVASGDPLFDRVIIWTRITEVEPSAISHTVNWKVARDIALTDVVAQGSQTTTADRDWTIKVDALLTSEGNNTAPGNQTYYYQFDIPALASESIIGRTRSAPAADQSPDDIRIAVASCSSFWSSTWSGYQHIAERNDIDLVLHCGDYIYDFVDEDEEIRARRNIFSTDYIDYRDWTNLEECRRRYALYRADPSLARAHQQHPWSIVWDNHDISVGYGNELPSPALDSTSTQSEILQAFWEWTPSRPAKDASGDFDLAAYENDYPTPPDLEIGYRKLDYGPMMDVFLVDHQYLGGRDGQTNTLFGDDQYAWFLDQMTTSANGLNPKTWRVICEQSWLGPWTVPEAAASQIPLPIESRGDQHPADRETMCTDFRNSGITNNIFVAGDMHGNWASDIVENGDSTDPNNTYLPNRNGNAELAPNLRNGAQSNNQNMDAGYYRATTGNIPPIGFTPAINNRALSVGSEFAPTSLGRGGADELLLNQGVPEDQSVSQTRQIENASMTANKNIQFMEWVEHGYGILHVEADRALCEFWWQDKFKPVEESPDVLGFQMIAWHDTDETTIPARYPDQIDPVTAHGLTIEATSSTRTPATPAPDADFELA